jgi:hypothetical protein
MRRPSGSSIAAGASRGAGWLRADLNEAVRVGPRAAGDVAAAAPPAELEAGLHRWSGRLSRSRALVLARRWLLVGLIVALVPGLVILAVGGSRPWWLFGVVLVGPLAGLVAVARRPSAARTAQVLDRRLGLADRLSTALELRSAPVAPTGLGGLVVNEASSALGQSLGSSRASPRRSPRELAWLLAAAVALALVIAVPRSGSTGASSTRASTGPAATAGGGAAAASPTHGRPAAGGRTTTPSAAPLPPPRIPKQTFGDGRSHYAPGSDPYGGQFRGGQLQTKQQAGVPSASSSGLGLAAPGGAAAQQGAAAGASGGSGNHGPTPSGGAGQAGTHTPAPGATGHPGSGSAGLSGAGGAGGAGGQQASGTPSGAQHPGAGAAAGAHGTASGTQTGSGGQSGGETAGGVRAGQSHGVGLVPALGGSGSGLPLQAGLAGSRAGRSGSQGATSRTANGGGGFARTAQGGSGAGGVGGAGANLPVLAPTFNSPSQPEPGLLQRYFGVANRLAFKGW